MRDIYRIIFRNRFEYRYFAAQILEALNKLTNEKPIPILNLNLNEK